MPDGSAIPETSLPSDVAVLQGMNRELLATVDRQLRRIGRLEHQLDQLLKRYYGPRADRIHRDQSLLFEEPPGRNRSS